jgi:hypothetical protein
MTELEGDRLFEEAFRLYDKHSTILNDDTKLHIKSLLIDAARHGSRDSISALFIWKLINDIEERLDYMEVYAELRPKYCALTLCIELDTTWSKESMYRLCRIAYRMRASIFVTYIEHYNLLRQHEDMYMRMYQRAQDATFTWLIVAKYMGLYRDVARLIAKIVWNGRMVDYHDHDSFFRKKLKK